MSIFGPLVGQPNIEKATLATLRLWLPFMLYEVERQNSLTVGEIPQPPSEVSYRGSVDFLDYQQDECPTVIVCANPVGEPERHGGTGYAGAFDVSVGAVCITPTEDLSRELAGYYGLAVSAAILQNGSLGDVASSTIMTLAPRVELPDIDVRQVMLGIVDFRCFVDVLVDPSAGTGTATPQQSPEYVGPTDPFNDFPTVHTERITVTGEPLT